RDGGRDHCSPRCRVVCRSAQGRLIFAFGADGEMERSHSRRTDVGLTSEVRRTSGNRWFSHRDRRAMKGRHRTNTNRKTAAQKHAARNVDKRTLSAFTKRRGLSAENSLLTLHQGRDLMDVLKETNFGNLGEKKAGKVRDIYDQGDKLILIATDR